MYVSGVFMYRSWCHCRHILYLCKMYIYEKDICLLGSVCMHVPGIHTTGHYEVVNTECVCRWQRTYNMFVVCAEYVLMHKLCRDNMHKCVWGMCG